jgi:putative ABC transport system permease protein
MIMNYMFDLKYAWRLLLKSWGYSLLCALVVALSLGLALWAYTLVYSQALKPLGFPGSERWYSVQIADDASTSAEPQVDAFTYQEIRKRSDNADYLGAFAGKTVLLSEGQASISLRAAEITPQLLVATGRKPHLGRVFDDSDSEAGAVPAAVLSYDAWTNYFASDPNVVGRQAQIDSQPVQIVGVMPKDFYAFRDFELWVPLQLTNVVKADESAKVLSPFIVLGDGQNLDALSKTMQLAVADVNKSYPSLFKEDRHVELIPARLMSSHGRLKIVAIIGFLAMAILLLGSVNISLVFLARLLERSRELALRIALGASRPRLLRQSLIETAFIVVAGLMAGYGLAALGVGWAQGLSEFTAQIMAKGRSSNVLMLKPSDLAVGVLAAIVVWLLSTLVPAWRIAKQDAAIALAGTGKGASVRSGSKSTGLLVGLQVLISSMVLVVCGNLVFAVDKEANKPTGLDTRQVMVSTYPTVFDERYPAASDRLRYWNELQSSVKDKLPGAEVAYATAIPTTPSSMAVALDTREGGANQGELKLPVAVVSDNYFALLGLKLKSGRLFDSTDNEASLSGAVIDEKTASRFWPGQNALGKRIQLEPAENGPWLNIVGIVSAVAGEPYSPDTGIVYRPLRQAAPEAFHVLVKLPDGAADKQTALRAAAFAVDRELPLHNLQMFDDFLTAANSSYKSLIPVFVVITFITALLAATGLFGLISRSVAQRTQEVGIRRALGATKNQSISMFLRQGAIYLVVGIVGMALGIVVTSLVSSAITNILDNVFLVSLAVLFLMTLVILSASYLPTRRAVALEPGDALRYE